jgi:formylglycine-generating enzyme required for sulfatase activity
LNEPSGKPRIFLCHASEDKPRVRELYHRLKEAGYHPWLDKEELLPGQDWWEEIERIIRDRDNLVVVCLSCHSAKKGVVQKEIKRALDVLDEMPEDTIYLIPARLEPCEVPRRLSKLHRVDLFEPDGFENLKEALDFELGKRHQSFEPEMVLIPAGEFLMGSDPEKDKDASDDEYPQHRLYLPDYSIAKTPVTNAQYLAFTQATYRDVPAHWKGKKPLQGREDHPVVNVNRRDAVAYCTWLAGVTGKAYRLPSEAEWEKAARGTDGRIYPWGNEWDAKRCNTREGGKGDTTPVGAYAQGASPYGVLDMAGNVWEWCHSLSRPYPYNAADGREDSEDEDVRVLRGGSFVYIAGTVRCAARYLDGPDFRVGFYGFRIVLAPGFL